MVLLGLATASATSTACSGIGSGMERYQLSQDFQEKQLQVLQRKYGGPQTSGHAALTIQRAFRRYSMAKKFADLTAQVKSEKRISRRIEQPAPPTPTAAAAAAAASAAAAAAPHHYDPEPYSPQTTPKVAHRQPNNASSSGGSPSSSSASLVKCSNCNHPAAAAASSAVPTDSSDLQSFSLDENSVYHTHHLHHHHHGHGHGHHNHNHNHHPQLGSSGSAGSTSSTPHHQHLQHHQPSLHGLTRQHSHPITKQRDASPQQNSSSSGGARLVRGRRTPSGGHDASSSSSPSAAAAAATASASSTSSSFSAKSRRTASASASASASSSSMRAYPYSGNHQDAVDGGVCSPSIAAPPSSSSAASVSLPPPAGGSGGAPRQFRSPGGGAGSAGVAVSSEQSAYTVNEVIRKRHYRTGLNIFNKKPEKGIDYLIKRGFLENSASAVARFLITRKGLSKQMIGEYLGNINHAFNSAVLTAFAGEMDFSGMHIDTALRKFQTYFRMPGEAQKIERLMEVFSARYCQCQPDLASKLHSPDTMFILAFAIILLNTDLHTQNLKPEKRMKLDDFVRNLRGIDGGHDLDYNYLMGIYERIRNQEFRPGSDHVTQVLKVQQTIVAKCPNLAIPHRRLVCYCRLYEIHDPYKKERPGVHQREVFLFNDILVVTKIHSRKKTTVTYAFRQSYVLAGMIVNLFETQFYPFGIQIAQKWDRKVVLMLNARNDHDRSKFVEDLKESIAEMDEMEAMRLEAELEKQKMATPAPAGQVTPVSGSAVVPGSSAQRGHHPLHPGAGGGPMVSLRTSNHHHSHHHHHHQQPPHHPQPQVVQPSGGGSGSGGSSVVLRRSAINNSLLDLSEASAEKLTRRASVGSLDSGMSISFQSTSVNSFQFPAGGGGGGSNSSNGAMPANGKAKRKS